MNPDRMALVAAGGLVVTLVVWLSPLMPGHEQLQQVDGIDLGAPPREGARTDNRVTAPHARRSPGSRRRRLLRGAAGRTLGKAGPAARSRRHFGSLSPRQHRQVKIAPVHRAPSNPAAPRETPSAPRHPSSGPLDPGPGPGPGDPAASPAPAPSPQPVAAEPERPDDTADDDGADGEEFGDLQDTGDLAEDDD